MTNTASPLRQETPRMRHMWWLSALACHNICTRSSKAAMPAGLGKTKAFSATCVQRSSRSDWKISIVLLFRTATLTVVLSHLRLPACSNNHVLVCFVPTQMISRCSKLCPCVNDCTHLYRLTAVCLGVGARVCVCPIGVGPQEAVLGEP